MKYFSFLIVLLIFLSCSDKETVKRERYIVFTLSNNALEPLTRGVEGEELRNENKIERLDIFFFDTQENCVFYPTASEMTISGAKVTIRVPETAADNMFGKNLTLYILANCTLPRSDMENLTFSALQALPMENQVTFNSNPFVAQPAFLMDGKTDVMIIDDQQSDLGNIILKRAASKMVVRITKAEIDGYTASNAKIRLYNYVDKTALGADAPMYNAATDEHKHSPYRKIYLPGEGTTESDPFYSYGNDWKMEIEKESYIVISLDWTRQSDGEKATYYYRIPFNYIEYAGENEEFLFRLRRNCIYQFEVDITLLGSLDPVDFVDITPHFMIKEWDTKNILVNILQYHYLFVNERSIIMTDIDKYTLSFSSSLPIEFVEVSAMHYQYESSGDVNEILYDENDEEFPEFTVDEIANTITISSPVPTNFVPKYMSFKVMNAAHLFQVVTIIQYPHQYLTSSPSKRPSDPSFITGSVSGNGNNNPEGASGRKNFNFYTITTTSLADGDPYRIGDPTIIENGVRVTGTDEISNQTISPKFVIASQRGISEKHKYTLAQARCSDYQEFPYLAGSWRMPTAAEMKIVANFQNHPQSALKGLFTPDISNIWWTAWQYYGMIVANGDLSSSGTDKTTYYTRCVHDVWRD